MSDRVSATPGGFIEIETRSGWRTLLRVSEIDQLVPRREGGTSIRCRGFQTILVDVPMDEVITTMEKVTGLRQRGTP